MSEANGSQLPVQGGASNHRPNQAASQPAGNRKSPRAGRSNYSSEECVNFLSIMEEILPIGSLEWEQVLAGHSVNYPGREVDSLRRKFAMLHRKSIPTGDPSMPVEVRMAKRVKYKIGARADIGDGEEELNLIDGSFSGGNEELSDANETESEEGSDTAAVVAPPAVMPPPAVVPRPEVAAPPAVVPQPAVAAPAAAAAVAGNQSAMVTSKPRPLVREMRPRGGKSPPSSTSSSMDDFVEVMKLQMIAESKSRQAFQETLQCTVAGLAAVFNFGKLAEKKRKRKYSMGSSDEGEE